MFVNDTMRRVAESYNRPQPGSPISTQASPSSTLTGYQPFALQSLRVAAQQSSGNVCISPASADAVVRILAESMQLRPRATTLQQLDPSQGLLEPQAGEGYQLRSGTAVFIDGQEHFRPAFIENCAHRGTHLERVPGSLVGAKDSINAFTQKHTLGIFPDFFDEATLEDKSCLVVNAIGFKGDWMDKFRPRNTKRDYLFHVSPDRTISCNMMFQYSPTIKVSESSSYLAVSLAYETTDVQPRADFSVFMPKGNVTVDEMLKELQSSGFPTFSKWEKLERLGLPKFKFVQRHDNLMAQLADSGITTLKEPLYITTGIYREIDAVAQVVSMQVDEEGCVAAAVIFTVPAPGSAFSYVKRRSIIFNKPFAFFIRMGEEPRHVLFAGVYNGEA